MHKFHVQNFQDTFETRERSFVGILSICMTVPLITVPCVLFDLDIEKKYSAKLCLSTRVPVTSVY